MLRVRLYVPDDSDQDAYPRADAIVAPADGFALCGTDGTDGSALFEPVARTDAASDA